MSWLKFALLLGCLAGSPLAAQTPIPAQPVEPIPARPVGQPAATPTPAPTNTPTATEPTVSVSILADSSLRAVLQDLAQTWADAQDSGPEVPLTLTNAAAMRSQLESNPAYDVVISPGADEMKAMTDKGLLAPEGKHLLARNTVVIYGRKALVKDDDLDWFDLVGTEWKKVAMGNPDLTISGQVAKRALAKHDLFDADHKSIYVDAANGALALQVLEREEADAAFVYHTDLVGISLPGFEVFPIDSTDAPPVFYLAAVGRLAKNPEMAQSFISFCGSEAARPIWVRHGFEMN